MESTGSKQFIGIRAIDIFELVCEGGYLMLERMRENLRSNPYRHIEGIARVYNEVRSRGAAGVELK